MKIQLQLSGGRLTEVKEELERLGIEISPDAELVLCEKDAYPDTLYGRDRDGYGIIDVNDIIYIESFGKEITIHTSDGAYGGSLPLYKTQTMLSPDEFMRISSSVIVSKKAIKHIGVSLYGKFALTLTGGVKVDVTRSYFYKFKEWMGF